MAESVSTAARPLPSASPDVLTVLPVVTLSLSLVGGHPLGDERLKVRIRQPSMQPSCQTTGFWLPAAGQQAR